MNKSINLAKWHGVLLITLFALTAFLIGDMDWCKAISFSPMIVGILLGMVYANTLRPQMPEAWAPGVKFCSKRILRTGIILYGFRLTLTDVADVGIAAIVIDAIIVCGTIGLGMFVGKLLKMDKDITLLTSCGSAICGAAAVLGAEGAIKAKPYKTAVAVSTVVIFGTIAMFLYPALYRAGVFGLPENLMGIYTGSTVHEVAHVVGAGNAIGEEAASISIIVKMIRVMMLVPVLLVLAFCMKPASESVSESKSESVSKSEPESEPKPKSKIVVPWFAILFLLVIVFNSLVALPSGVTAALNTTSTFFLTMAMTALGVETSIDKFKQAGAKPFILAFILFIWLILAGWLMVRYMV
ncbi:MAG: YeiH family putative sulfate export transporter [Bacteroidaceae bacterium]|nr:YeiH family putative sulfate export transporter [Bacteroidaceae bacterium]